MMSSPDLIKVDHPGATGTRALPLHRPTDGPRPGSDTGAGAASAPVNHNSTGTNNSSSSTPPKLEDEENANNNAKASSSSSPPPPYGALRHGDYTSACWTIGATDGTYALPDAASLRQMGLNSHSGHHPPGGMSLESAVGATAAAAAPPPPPPPPPRREQKQQQQRRRSSSPSSGMMTTTVTTRLERIVSGQSFPVHHQPLPHNNNLDDDDFGGQPQGGENGGVQTVAANNNASDAAAVVVVPNTRRRLSLTNPSQTDMMPTPSTLSTLSNALPPGSGHPSPSPAPTTNAATTTTTTAGASSHSAASATSSSNNSSSSQHRQRQQRGVVIQSSKSLYQDRLFNQPSAAVEAVLAASCEAMNFDIAEMWLRTGPKTHQLTNSHLRPTALEDSVRNELVDVYYGERSGERTHRLSPALCKRAKEAMDVVWVTAHTQRGREALKVSISDVRTAVAVPVCHKSSNTNITLIFFSIRRCLMRPTAVEFLVHMSLAAAVASVNSLGEEGFVDLTSERQRAIIAMGGGGGGQHHHPGSSHSDSFQDYAGGGGGGAAAAGAAAALAAQQQMSVSDRPYNLYHPPLLPGGGGTGTGTGTMSSRRGQVLPRKESVTGARLDLKWNQLKNVEYLTDGGNNWIHTAVFNDRPVVVKTLKPECQDLALAINEIEGELDIHSKLDHPNIVELVGAGTTSKGVRFVVMERLDGGSLTQVLGYDTRIRDRRRRFWKKKQFAYVEMLKTARSIADAMAYCQERAIPGVMCLHRDLKPDNIGFTLNGEVKIIDFGLARLVENATPDSDEVYHMSGETGSLRYMAPEVADAKPYNHKADVYSFGIILWEINAYKKPFDGMNRESFYECVVHGGERPPINKKWPEPLSNLMTSCWSNVIEERPTFSEVVDKLDGMLAQDKGGGGGGEKKKPKRGLSGLIDRHSTWF